MWINITYISFSYLLDFSPCRLGGDSDFFYVDSAIFFVELYFSRSCPRRQVLLFLCNNLPVRIFFLHIVRFFVQVQNDAGSEHRECFV